MKKLLLLLVLMTGSIIGYSQTNYIAYKTQLRHINESTNDWELDISQRTQIRITTTRDKIFINANLPAVIKLDLDEQENIKIKGLTGIRCLGVVYSSTEYACMVDTILENSTQDFYISITYENDKGFLINLRYYLRKIEDE